jgi:hypothetical protein
MVILIQRENVIFFNWKSSIKNKKFGCGFAALSPFAVEKSVLIRVISG